MIDLAVPLLENHVAHLTNNSIYSSISEAQEEKKSHTLHLQNPQRWQEEQLELPALEATIPSIR